MNSLLKIVLLIIVIVTIIACRDKETEKKIASLEAKLNQMEAGKPPASTIEPAPVVPETKPEGPLPVVEFEKTEHDFGTIKEGEKVSYTYTFKNTGEAPLIIQSAQPSCGCTVPEWSKDPVPVGGTGFIKVEFDSNGKPNIQNKTVTVTANTWPKQTSLRFKAMVTPKQDAAPPAK